MDIQIRNPSEHPDWDASLLSQNNHSFFHTSAWAKVLEKTYRFKPVYFVVYDGNRLVTLMPMMEVHSLLTGKRGVSLPFTDLCPPYAPARKDLLFVQLKAIEYGKINKWRYIEWRDNQHIDPARSTWESFYVHDIDLDRTETDIFDSLSNSNRRNISKAIRKGVRVRFDQSREALNEFYRLNLATRKRHGLPPQPLNFFKNIYEFIILKDCGVIASAYYEGRVVASSVFFHFGRAALFKYGASDIRYHHLRPNNLLMWETCMFYARRGFLSMNLGRTEPQNEGLLRYKRAWGAKERMIKYHRYDINRNAYILKHSGGSGLLPKIFSRIPISIARIIGRLAYRHVG